MTKLKQGFEDVEAYIHEFKKLMMKLNKQTMARFMGGLNKEIARK